MMKYQRKIMKKDATTKGQERRRVTWLPPHQTLTWRTMANTRKSPQLHAPFVGTLHNPKSVPLRYMYVLIVLCLMRVDFSMIKLFFVIWCLGSYALALVIMLVLIVSSEIMGPSMPYLYLRWRSTIKWQKRIHWYAHILNANSWGLILLKAFWHTSRIHHSGDDKKIYSLYYKNICFLCTYASYASYASNLVCLMWIYQRQNWIWQMIYSPKSKTPSLPELNKWYAPQSAFFIRA